MQLRFALCAQSRLALFRFFVTLCRVRRILGVLGSQIVVRLFVQLRAARLDHGQAKRDDDEHRRAQLDVLRRHICEIDERIDDAVDDAAERHAEQKHGKVALCRHNVLADDDRGKTGDNRALTEAPAGCALRLRDKRARKSYQRVGDDKPDNLGYVGIDALSAAHALVHACRADCAADLGTEKPIARADYRRHANQAENQRGVYRLHSAERRIERVVGGDGYGRLVAHDNQRDRIERGESDDARKYRRYFEFGVQDCGDQSRSAACKKRDETSEIAVPAVVVDKHGGDGSAQRETALAGEVGKVKQTEGDEHAYRHYRPKQTLIDTA